MGAGDPKAGLKTCIASTLPTGPFPQQHPSEFFYSAVYCFITFIKFVLWQFCTPCGYSHPLRSPSTTVNLPPEVLLTSLSFGFVLFCDPLSLMGLELSLEPTGLTTEDNDCPSPRIHQSNREGGAWWVLSIYLCTFFTLVPWGRVLCSVLVQSLSDWWPCYSPHPFSQVSGLLSQYALLYVSSCTDANIPLPLPMLELTPMN